MIEPMDKDAVKRAEFVEKLNELIEQQNELASKVSELDNEVEAISEVVFEPIGEELDN